ncbi:MAG: gliding motility-associated-like protein [Crocinitomix sp.]|jgi:gliding motility-associated-like protein
MKKLGFIWLVLLTLICTNFATAQDCLSFDGGDNYIEADNTALNGIGTGDFTFEAWVNGGLVGQNAHPTIFSNRPTPGVGVDFFFHNNWGGSLYKMLCVQLGGVNYFVFDNGTFAASFFDGTCHHVAITREGTLLTFFADGVSFGTRTIGGGAPSAGSGADLWIGQDDPTNNTYLGHISQVRIWDDVRTDAEIADNKDITIPGASPNLVGYWEMSEGAGQLAVDLTGTADGQLGSTAAVDAQDPTWGEACCIACDVAIPCWDIVTICDGMLVDLDTLLCLTGTPGGVWSGLGVTGSIFDPAGLVGDIAITYDVGTDPCDATLTQNITITAGPSVDAGLDQSICEGENITLTADNPDGAIITWDLGITDGLAFTPAGTGTTTYTVTATDPGTGCENVSTVDVTVNPIPVVTASADLIEICLGESVTLTGGGATTYTWDMGATNGIPFTPATTGTFTFTVTGTTDGCSSTATINISVIDCEVGIADFELDNVCLGDCITLTDLSTGTIAEWAWDFGGAADPNTSDDQNPFVCFTTVGDFIIQLTITSPSGTTSSISNSITVNDLPDLTAQLDTIIEIGDDANLIATSTSDGIYSWTPENDVDCPSCAITTADPQDSTIYVVTLIDENGCKAEASVLVLVNFSEGIGVPSAFSPNGDGYNDVLFVKGFGISALHFIIYNRYGEVVFESNSQNIGWDGTFKNRDENPGVFTWVVHYDLISGKKGMIKGNTTLVE